MDFGNAQNEFEMREKKNERQKIGGQKLLTDGRADATGTSTGYLN